MRPLISVLTVAAIVALWVYVLALGSYDYQGGILVAPVIALVMPV